jgi:hypothetical protein
VGKIGLGLGIAKKGFGMLGKAFSKSKTSNTISSVKPGKNLKKKRDVQDSVVRTKDKVMESLDTKGKLNVRTKVKLSDTNKAVAKIVDKK